MASFQTLNELGAKRKPFLFVCDYKAQNLEIFELDSKEVLYSFESEYNYTQHNYRFETTPINKALYTKKFSKVIEEIKSGNTYLLNLTQPTKISTPLSLEQIYHSANAKYKLKLRDEFVCFSPEAFIDIKENAIHTYPMKGTIDASISNAREKILANEKEMAEHIMVVDLLRNDLSMVATKVRVEKFRFCTTIDAGEKKLLQVSSHIRGELEQDWHSSIGDILKTLLPAGSITGTPKKKTMQIIDEIEGYERGFFSGVFGVYDGVGLQSAVMIRFVEKTTQGYIYKSGGGITLESDCKSEYDELLQKVYLP